MTEQITLETLPDAYRAARTVTDRLAKYTVEACPPDTCRYCGGHRRAWRGTALDGHALCVVTERFMRQVSELYWQTPGLTRMQLARCLGVSQSTIVSWTYERKERAA